MKGRLALAVVLLASTVAARANTFSTDISDIWWNANESGWGMNVIHQNEILFITFFVYGSSGQATWYVAPATAYSGPSGTSLVYSGPLFATTGPWIGTSFNPNAVNARQVGNITVTVTAVETMNVLYTVDGLSVSKSLTRQTFRTNALNGGYIGAAAGTYTAGCPTPGYQEEVGIITVSQGSPFTVLTLTGTTGSCTYSGNYQQAGRMGAISGSVSCTNGSRGTFSAFEIEGSASGLTARASVQYPGCSWSGRFGGLRRGS